MSKDADLLMRVFDTLSVKIGDVAPGSHTNFYAEYCEFPAVVRRMDAPSPADLVERVRERIGVLEMDAAHFPVDLALYRELLAYLEREA